MILQKKMNIEKDLVEIDPAPELSLLISGRCTRVSCGQKLAPGDLIAESGCPEQGDLLAPVACEITELDSWHIVLRVLDSAAENDNQEKFIKFEGLSREEVRGKLSRMGVSLPETGKIKTLIINASREEPEIFYNEKLLKEYENTLSAGMKLAEYIYKPLETRLAVTEGFNGSVDWCSVKMVPMAYPGGLDPMVVKSVTGKEMPDDVVVLSASLLFELGRVVQSGLLQTDTIVQAGDDFFRVRVGTPVGVVLSAAGIKTGNRGRVVLGSRMRGMAAYSLQQGVEKDTQAVFYLEETPEPIAEDVSCVGCGECVRNCPAGIDPSYLSGCAEFGFYEKARDNHIASCIDCGICSYVCIARRPVLQYIRLARRELKLIDGACEQLRKEGEE